MQIRVSKEDLEKERGAVMEEYRGNRNASGRMQDAHWILMMEGSKVLQLASNQFDNFYVLICQLLHQSSDKPVFSMCVCVFSSFIFHF